MIQSRFARDNNQLKMVGFMKIFVVRGLCEKWVQSQECLETV